MVWRSLQDPGDIVHDADKQMHAWHKCLHTNTYTHTYCSDGLDCRDAHGNKMDTPLKDDQRSLEIKNANILRGFAWGSWPWH